MAGIVGSKQKKVLDEDQLKILNEKLFKVEHGKLIKLCILKSDLDHLLSIFSISNEAFQRRWRISGGEQKRIITCYGWEDRLNESLSTKSFLFYECEFCKRDCLLQRAKFVKRKVKSFKSCGLCHARFVAGLPDQKLINSLAQKIAQNKSETLQKMSSSLKKVWERDYEQRCNSIRESYVTNPSHRENVRNASLKNWRSEEYRKKVEKSNAYCWGYYSGIFYQSLCELAFILWCEDQNIEVKRYDKEHIEYLYEGVIRSYIPDFIIDSKTIVEVKSSLDRENHTGKLEQVLLKARAASELCKMVGVGYRIVETSKDIPSKFYRKAGKIHHGKTQKENILSVQGKSS